MANVRRKTAVAWILAAAIGALAPCAAAQESQPAPKGTGEVLTPDTDQPGPTGQTGEGATTQPGEGQQQPRGLFGGGSFIWIMLGGFLLLYFWMSRGRRKKETKRKEMLSNLKKGDKITSIGGVVGSVIEVRDDEVTVKVDENNNVRMRFARWAIRGIGEEAKTEQPEDKR